MAINSVQHGFLCNNSSLSILMYGVMLLPDTTSYDKNNYCIKSLWLFVGPTWVYMLDFFCPGSSVLFTVEFLSLLYLLFIS